MAQAVSTAPIATRTSTMADKKREETIAGYGFLAPAIIIFMVFLIIPILFSVYISLTDWNGTTPLNRADAFQFVGLNNYTDLLAGGGNRQATFFKALKNTIYFVIGVVPTQTIISLVLAVILNQRWLKAKGFFRTAFYFPSITSSVVISLIFMWMFTRGGLVNSAIASLIPSYENVNWLDDSSGIFHNILGLFGVDLRNAGEWARAEVLGLRGWDWVSGPSVTMFMIMILNTWTTIGTMMVIFLAALQNIPGSVYEAAVVDGASAWQIFRKITVPLLRPTTFFVVTLGLIGTFQVFDQIYVINKDGGPAQTTLTIAYIVYMNGFRNQSMGVAAATAIILFVIIFIFTLIQRRIVGETAET
jgi:multiple sugar transport system permease protein